MEIDHTTLVAAKTTADYRVADLLAFKTDTLAVTAAALDLYTPAQAAYDAVVISDPLAIEAHGLADTAYAAAKLDLDVA